MEMIIVIGLVAASVYWIVRMFIKQTDGEGGCNCSQNCKSCGEEEDEKEAL